MDSLATGRMIPVIPRFISSDLIAVVVTTLISICQFGIVVPFFSFPCDTMPDLSKATGEII